MLLIRSGYNNDDHIVVTCQCCNAIYAIEDRNDWSGEYLRMPMDSQYEKIYAYRTICPECGYGFDIDCNPKDNPYLVNGYRLIFNRKDWIAKYEMPPILRGGADH